MHREEPHSHAIGFGARQHQIAQLGAGQARAAVGNLQFHLIAIGPEGDGQLPWARLTLQRLKAIADQVAAGDLQLCGVSMHQPGLLQGVVLQLHSGCLQLRLQALQAGAHHHRQVQRL